MHSLAGLPFPLPTLAYMYKHMHSCTHTILSASVILLPIWSVSLAVHMRRAGRAYHRAAEPSRGKIKVNVKGVEEEEEEEGEDMA
mmetsp:Transcript_17275/g.43066  ORF Transcript_17275/g.43066 Transcript_17275/m.43066 type:complete len:85 (-) Transcript_17275:1648-1902(-)